MARTNQAAAPKADWRADRKDELSELLRRKIVEAARACLKETDYAKLRMDMVAREAGCSRGTLYRYFSSKDEILLIIAIDNYQRIADAVVSEIENIGDPRLQFATGLARSMALAQSDDASITMNMELITRANIPQSAQLSAVITESLAPYMEQAREQDLLAGDITIKDASQWILQASTGLLDTGWPSVGGKALSPKKQVDYLCRYLLYPVFNMQGIV
jgi:AcrR family transcriptional regulator